MINRRGFIEIATAGLTAIALPWKASLSAASMIGAPAAHPTLPIYATLRRIQEFAARFCFRGSYRTAITRVEVDDSAWSVATDARTLLAVRDPGYADCLAQLSPEDSANWPGHMETIIRRADEIETQPASLNQLREFCGPPSVTQKCHSCQGTGKWGDGYECECCTNGEFVAFERPVIIAGVGVYASLLAWTIRDLPGEFVRVGKYDHTFSTFRHGKSAPVSVLYVVADDWILVQCQINDDTLAEYDAGEVPVFSSTPTGANP